MTPLIIGNWKLNPASVKEANALSLLIAKKAQTLTGCQLILAPSNVHLNIVNEIIAAHDNDGVSVQLASQDVSPHTAKTGAYTGDNSAVQLKDIGVNWVIVGHSERRQYYQECNKMLLSKVKNSLASGLGVIFCIGESESQYAAGDTQAVLGEQLAVIKSLFDPSDDELTVGLTTDLTTKLIIAYEPVWAIGTGKVPNVDEIINVNKNIRSYLCDIDNALNVVPIIYGGSVKPDNASEFADSPLINGVLVGGASLNADSFIDIARAFS